ncbi:MAG: WD40 repeat domain-containing protein [Kofleriaceae bacterium]
MSKAARIGLWILAAGCTPRPPPMIDDHAHPGAHVPMEPQRAVTLHTVAELTTGYGRRLAFAPDGARWASAITGAAHLWRATEPAGDAVASSATTDRLRFSRDGARLLLAPYIYDLARGAWLAQAPLRDKLGPSTSEPGAFGLVASAWAPDGEDLVVSTSFGPHGNGGGIPGPRERVLVLRGPERALVDTLYEGDREMRRVAIDDHFVAMAGRDVAIWSRAERRRVADLPGHAVTVTELAFSPDGRKLASLDGRGVLLVWDTAHWQAPPVRIQTSPEAALAVAFHPGRPLIATGGYDGIVRLWSLAAGEAPVFATASLGGWIEALAFDPSGTRLLAAANADPARIVMYELAEASPAGAGR